MKNLFLVVFALSFITSRVFSADCSGKVSLNTVALWPDSIVEEYEVTMENLGVMYAIKLTTIRPNEPRLTARYDFCEGLSLEPLENLCDLEEANPRFPEQLRVIQVKNNKPTLSAVKDSKHPEIPLDGVLECGK